MVWSKGERVKTFKRRLPSKRELKERITWGLSRFDKTSSSLLSALLLTLSITACASQGTVAPSPQPVPTRTSVRLGPTSTSSPIPPTSIPTPPTPTLVPIPPVSGDDWSRGPQDALVTLVVYSDFQ